ncbi:putative excision repair cross-complementing 1 ercc1 [Hibiscus syriacus]|uniref:RING-type E3 ubiquitin transferase n=1 Tax=Hibiscus syriacus TaxID=106335 RepID=A0A6A2Z6S4_HIBSY|nr:E3 ubiquitin-protein ligase ATL31-like [Hibiscus syriacus]KAE8687306.1 putative excision repair cross-complementing 1 ercc1 [Hibiscus syriacus]
MDSFSLFFSLLFLSPLPSAAQPSDPNDGRYSYSRFTPSMAIIVVFLIAALFFMGFFSIYIRNCSEANANASVVRPVNGGTGRSRRGMRGLEASVIETFPTMVYSEVKVHKIGKGALECAVCLNEFEDDETLRLIPKCDHVFHPECIDAWLASHTTCPVCRANLAPQHGDPVSQPTDSDNTAMEMDLEAQNDGGDSDTEEERRRNANNVDCDDEAQVLAPDVEVIDLNRTLNRNRTRGSISSRTRRFFFPRSHTTGHSLVQPGENTDRFTLRLPVDVRKQLMNRKLNRATSLMLPRERSSKRGYRAGEDDESSRGKSLRWFDKSDRRVNSDRWIFSMAPPFISRASSMKSPKVAADNGEGTSGSNFTVGPAADSNRPPV